MDGVKETNGTSTGDTSESNAVKQRPRKERSWSEPYYAALDRLMARMGPVRMVGKTDAREYTRRLSAARRDLSTAGPHLRRAILTWGRKAPAPLFTEENEPIAEAFDAFLAYQRVFFDSIDDDDEAAELERKAAAAAPVVNVTLPPDLLAPVAGQLAGPLAERVAVAARQEANVARLADQLAPKPGKMIDTREVANRMNLKSTQRVAAMADDGTIPDHCKVPGTGNGKPWQFWTEPTEAWIAAGRPPANKGKGKNG